MTRHASAPATFAAAMWSGGTAIADHSGGSEGEGTMVDALAPALRALSDRIAEDEDLAGALVAAADSAEAGARITAALPGQRSRDPGAASAAIVFRALAESARQPG